MLYQLSYEPDDDLYLSDRHSQSRPIRSSSVTLSRMSRPRASFVVAASAFVVVAFGAAPAAARLGNAAYLVATACNGCHAGADRPTLTVTQTTPDPLVPGGSVVFHVDMAAANAGAGRFASFSASVPSAAGHFKDGDDTDVCEVTGGCPGGRTAIRDITRRAFDDTGHFAWDIELDGLNSGSFNLAVGVNDHNDNRLTSGDRNAGVTVAFVVAEGEGEGGEGEGEGDVAEGEGEGDVGGDGSCCAGSASQASLAAAALVVLRRRGLLLRRSAA